ncbi:uncharacterized protein [Diabrotica undecimpunctata]|uniref:uncharacterized protein n=1 Tax=Diabrotica undecimpunctata TaxID=50387 RepID=UPI003B63DB0C
MTSTSFNIGLTGTKNSSRVLKPPGGGHTDIFGVNGDSENTKPSKKQIISPTSITSCLCHEKEEKPKENDQLESILDKELNFEKKCNDNSFDDVKEAKNDEKKNIPEPPRRIRVPPGGFSSGLW